MNFFELINATLQELNYKQVSAFSELTKPDHKKLMAIVSRMNDILLDSCDWEFMLRECFLDVPAGADRVALPFEMKIKSLSVDGVSLFYTDRYDYFLDGNGFSTCYSVFNRKVLLTPVNEKRTLKILYITQNHAKNADGEEVERLVNADDVSLLPDEHARTALIYGACLQFKSNPQHPKYKHWLQNFTDARSKMRATREYVAQQPPEIKLPRWTLGYDRYHNLI